MAITWVIRRSALHAIIKMGVAYLNVRVLKCLKEELAWVIDERLQVISNKMFFKIVVPLRN